jgi:phosphate transport system permease protein
LHQNLSLNRLRTLEREKPLAERSQADLTGIALKEVAQPDALATWGLFDSLLKRHQIAAQAAQEYPQAQLVFQTWLDRGFLTDPQSSDPFFAGVRTAALGSLLVIAITALVAFPIGIGAAIYLQEYAADRWINRMIQTNIHNLAGVPSIIYGMLGLAIFVRALGPLTSGAMFAAPHADPNNGRTILSAGLTMALLILPIVIINSQEAIKAVPQSLREAAYGLGATRWQTVWHHVLPAALPGILTGAILSVSRAFGETAPLIIIGAATYIPFDPNGVFSKFTTLPIQIYQWTSRPQDEFRNIAAAAIIVLMALLLALNATAILLRNRYNRRME